MSEESDDDRLCARCTCRNCSPIKQMAERVDAYSAAKSLLGSIEWEEGNGPTPHEHILLANWLMYGDNGDE